MTMAHQLKNPDPRRRFGGVLPFILGIVIMFILAGGFVAYRWLGPSQSNGQDAANTADEWDMVETRSFDITVTAAGELRAKEQVEISCELEYPSSVIEIVEEGAAVNKGDVLVKLADEQLKEKIETAERNLTLSKHDALLTKQTLSIEEGETQSESEKAQVTLEMAELDLQKWDKGDVVQKLRELNLALEKAKRTLKRAEETVALSVKLFAREFISKPELEDDRLNLLESQEALKTAELDIEVYNLYTHPKEKRKYNSDVDQANAALKRTKQKNTSRLTKAKATFDAATQQHTAAIERLTYLKKQFAATIIIAPQSGMVVYASSVGSSRRRYSSDPVGPGMQVHFREKLIYLPNTEHMSAAVKVHEAMIRHVQVGQKVNLTIDARPGRIFEGVVASKGITAEKGSWFNPNLREYVVMVDLPKGVDLSLKPGMRSLGKIMVESVHKVLAVPVQAVHSLGKDRFCYVRGARGQLERRVVQIGRHSETLVEITKGLKEGESVLMRQPRPGELPDHQMPGAQKGKKDPKQKQTVAQKPRPSGQKPGTKPGAGQGRPSGKSEHPKGKSGQDSKKPKPTGTTKAKAPSR